MIPSTVPPRTRAAWYAVALAATFAVAPALRAQQTVPTLQTLLNEAALHNPQIRAARAAFAAALERPSQERTLPDPVITFQQNNVGTPVPFLGDTSSNMQFTGIGVTQVLPWPGKLHLKGEIAQSQAAVAQQNWRTLRRMVLARARADWFALAASRRRLMLLNQERRLFQQIATVAADRYSAGQAQQTDVLRAQMEQTRLLSRITREQERYQDLQIDLKTLLNRAPASIDIAPGKLTLSPLPPQSVLPGLVTSADPAVHARREVERGDELRIELAHKNFRPDFTVGYMYKRTGSRFPDDHLLTVNLRFPLFWKHRQQPALAQAVQQLHSARHLYRQQIQTDLGAAAQAWVAARTDEKVLRIDRLGLIPQAETSFQSALAGYQDGRVDFQTVLASFRDVLELRLSDLSTLSNHEAMVSRIVQITGWSGTSSHAAVEVHHAAHP